MASRRRERGEDGGGGGGGGGGKGGNAQVHFLGDVAGKRAVFDECARGLGGAAEKPVVVVLAGPHGCGKTYVLQQVAAAAELLGVRVVTHERLQRAAAMLKSGFRFCAARCAVLVDDVQLADAATARVLRQIAEPLAQCTKKRKAPHSAVRAQAGARPQLPLVVLLCVRDLHSISRRHPAAWIKTLFPHAVRALRRPAHNQLVACAKALWRAACGKRLAREHAAEAARMCQDGDLAQLLLLLQMHAGRRNEQASCADARPTMFAEAGSVLEGNGAYALESAPALHLADSGALGLVHACYPLALHKDDMQAACDVAEALSDADRLHDERLAGLGLHNVLVPVGRGAVSWNERLAVLEANRRVRSTRESVFGLDGRAFDAAVVRCTGTTEEMANFMAVALRSDAAAVDHRCGVVQACFDRLTLDERSHVAQQIGFSAREMRDILAARASRANNSTRNDDTHRLKSKRKKLV
jgi:hypothetical protein